MTVPAAALAAGRDAANRALMTRNQSDPAFAEKLAADVLEAGEPFMAAAERERIRGILRHDPVIMADPVRIAELFKPDQVIYPGTAGITHHLPA